MRKSVQIVALVAGTALLGGCQMFQSNSSRLQAGLRIPQQVEPRLYAQQQLEAGRVALTGQNYAAAVAAFRNASLDPATAAAANNGLGVAYAGIGRNDLAERYFRAAVTEAPTVTRYQDNLVRLLRVNYTADQARLARAEAVRRRPAPTTSRTTTGTSFRAALRIEPARARLERLADGAVNLRTGFATVSSARPIVVAMNAAEARPLPEAQPAPEQTREQGPEQVQVQTQAQPETQAETQVLVAVTAPVVPADPKPEQPKPQSAVILVSDRRSAAITATPAQPEPATLAISSTGRRYGAPLETVTQRVVVFTAPRHAVAAASVSASGLRPRHLPEPSFGLVEPESGAERLALAGQ